MQYPNLAPSQGPGVNPSLPPSAIPSQQQLQCPAENIAVPIRSNANTVADQPPRKYNVIDYIAIFGGYFLWLIFLPMSMLLYPACRILKQHERAIILRRGQLRENQELGPGLVCFHPCADILLKADMRAIYFDVPPQQIVTKDGLSITVDAIVFYRVVNVARACFKVENFAKSTVLLACSVLRANLGTKTLIEILAERESIAKLMQQDLDVATDPWGVLVERVEISDIKIPQSLQFSLAAEANAVRATKAKLVVAEAERKVARAIKDGADIMKQSAQAMPLQYLQTLAKIGVTNPSLIIWPVPMEVVHPFMKV